MNEHAKIGAIIMNEHAKKIWRAWVDGKQVQWNRGSGWVDQSPLNVSETGLPQNEPDIWRIKPKRKLISLEWRVALMRHENDPNDFLPMCVLPHSYDQIESSKKFVEWATDVTYSDYFVEVEE